MIKKTRRNLGRRISNFTVIRENNEHRQRNVNKLRECAVATVIYLYLFITDIRELKQSSCRTAMVVNKQLNFRVKTKPQTTSTYCIFEAYFMIKSV